MLILARRQDESLIFKTPDGKEIKVMILDLNNGRARIGIDAPSDVEILREELLRAG